MSNQRRTRAMVVSSALLAIAPKCPLCLSAFLGTFGVATLPASAYRAWLAPLTAIWLSLTIGMVAFNSGRRHYGPPLLGFLAGLAVLFGKFVLDNESLVYAGVAALLGSVVWLASRRPIQEAKPCAQCESPPVPNDGQPGLPIDNELAPRGGR